jgi:DNA-binding response OmpR family regulator
MSQDDQPLHARLRTLGGGLSAAAAAASTDVEAQASVRRLAGALAAAAASAGLAELASRARALQEESDDGLEAAGAALAAYCFEVADAGPRASHRVLVVDDDPLTVALMEATLSAPDRTIHTAASAADARAVLAGDGADLVVLDLHLPDADGRDLLVELRHTEATRATPVLVLSGDEGDVAPAECYALGADAFLSKPPDIQLLRSTVTRQLSKRQVSGPRSPEAPHRILVVEDDDIVAAVIEHRLKKAGFVTVRVDDGSDGFQAVRDTPFDLVVLDVKLPGMDGFDLLRRIRETPDIQALPIIILSALDAGEDVVRGLNLGADDYVSKPFSPAELMARIRRLLEA